MYGALGTACNGHPTHGAIFGLVPECADGQHILFNLAFSKHDLATDSQELLVWLTV